MAFAFANDLAKFCGYESITFMKYYMNADVDCPKWRQSMNVFGAFIWEIGLSILIFIVFKWEIAAFMYSAGALLSRTLHNHGL